MNDNCLMFPCVKNSKGEIRDSRLFKSLLSLFDGNRALAWHYYEIATDANFIDANKGSIITDDYGEMSLQQFANLMMETEDDDFPVRKAFTSTLHPGQYGFTEAIEKVEAFNRGLSSNSMYMASLRQEKDSSLFTVYLANRTKSVQNKIKKIVRQQNLSEKLIALLAKNGVSTDLTRGTSRYSTENIEQTADGLYSLIRLREHGTIGEHAEAAGHFVVGAMGNSPLVTRLESLLENESARNSALKDAGIDPTQIDLGSNPAREAAGILVGKALERKLSNNIFVKLADRIITACHKLLSKIGLRDITKIKAESKAIADQFATDFIDGNLEKGVEKAIEISETRYRKAQREGQKKVTVALNEIETLRREFVTIEGAKGPTVEKLNSIIKQSGALKPNENADFMDPMVFLNLIDGITSILNSLRPDNSAPITEETPLIELETKLKESADRLIKYSLCARKAQDMLYVLNSYYHDQIVDRLKKDPTDPDGARYKQYIEVKQQLEKHITDVFDGISSAYLNEARNISAAYLSQLYGDRFIAYNEGLLWNGSRGNHVTFTFGKAVRNESKNKIDITQYVYEDDGRIQYFLGSLVNSKDVGAQLIVRAIKASKRSAEQRMGEAFEQLMNLDSKAKKLGIRDYQRFYERNDKGELTGNLKWMHYDTNTNTYIELDWDSYERSRDAIHQEIYEDFKRSEDFKLYAKASAPVKQVILNEYFDNHPKLVKWHSENSIYSEDHNQFIPKAEKYGKTTSLTDNEIAWYKEYLQAFEEYKSWLGSKKMAIQLAPQTRGSIWNTMKNLFGYKGLRSAVAIGQSIKLAICSLYSRDNKLINEASHYNWNTKEDTILDSYINAKNNINTQTSRLLPVYHNRKLKDPQSLDTNLIAATMKFAAMAAQYKASSDIQSQLEITAQQLEGRILYNSDEDKLNMHDAGSKSSKVHRQARVNKSIREYIDANFYGLNYGIFTGLHDLTNNKLAQKAAHLGGKIMVGWYLANNAISSAVNLLTGNLEIVKDAIVGNEFNAKDWLRANAMYITYGIPTILDNLAVDNRFSKVNRFNQKLNTTDNSEAYYTTFRTWGERVAAKWTNPINVAMTGYAVTEHYMQSVPFMAMAMHTKLVTYQGKKTTLWDELQTPDSAWQQILGSKKSMQLVHQVFESKEHLYKYKHVEALIEAFQQANEKEELSFADFVRQLKKDRNDIFLYFQEVCRDEGILDSYFEEDTVDYDDFLELLHRRAKNLTYNEDNIIGFSQKAREAANRLHGVYNREDKSAFNRTLLGMLLLPFKGYAFGMIQKRFGGRHYNVALGRESEGYLNTSLKVGVGVGKDVLDISRGILGGIAHIASDQRQEYFQLTADAIKHLPNLAMSFLTNNDKVLSNAGMNKTQAQNIRHAALAMAVITGIRAFVMYAMTMALGEEDDDLIDSLAIYKENGEIDVEKSMENIQDYMKKRGYKRYAQEDNMIDPEHPDFIGALNDSEAARKRVRQKHTTPQEQNKAQILYYLEELKRLNRQHASYNRPGWNIAYAFASRMLGEQMAFNTYSGLKNELLSGDIMPLSVKAVYEIVELSMISSKVSRFESSNIELVDPNASEERKKTETEYASAMHYLLGNPIEGTSISVSDAVEIVRMSPEDIRRTLKQYAKDTHQDPDKVTKSYIRGIQQHASKAVTNQWKRMYPKTKIEEAYFTKSKRGYYERFTSKGSYAIDKKLHPEKQLQSVSHNGPQYIRDMYFGRTK